MKALEHPFFWGDEMVCGSNSQNSHFIATSCIILGHIHELQIHVPWTRLQSEPIVLTINTIECVLRLHDGETGSNSSSEKQVLGQIEA